MGAAREEFGARGFDAATVRSIGTRAGVDPALIAHYFGGKRQLFLATLDFPFDPAEELAQVTAGPPEELARRVLGRLLQVWDSPAGAAAVAVVRTAVQRDWSVALVREFALSRALRPLMSAIDAPQAERQWRANLVATQLIGLIFTRYVLRLEPLASAPHSAIVDAIAPTLQRYLTGPLDEP